MPNLDISTKRKTCATIVAVAMLTLAVSVTTSQAQTNVYTDPVGFITLTAGGTNDAPGASPYISQYALGMTQLPASRGNATANGANVVAVNAALTAGQFNLSADGHPTAFIEITSGSFAGLLDDINSNDTANVYTFDDLTSFIGGGVTYKVYPHWTIGTVFGPQNQAGFLGASTSSSADQIQVWNPNTQGFTVYYYKTGGLGGTGWRSGASTSINVTNQQLYVDQGILVVRRTSGDVSVQLVGGVKLGTTISPVVSNGLTFAGNVFPAGQPLGTSTLYTGSPATGLLGASTASAADQVQVWNPLVQGYTVYYYKTGGLGGTGWRSGASTSIDASTNTIGLAQLGLIVRRAGNPAFNWFAPQPFTP
jgi:uncharacterized protein (TIGR02597 family)